jgi:hypothetical protein
MDSSRKNKVDEESVGGLSYRIVPGFCHHHDFLSGPCTCKKSHLASSAYIRFFRVPTLEEYPRWSNPGWISKYGDISFAFLKAETIDGRGWEREDKVDWSEIGSRDRKITAGKHMGFYQWRQPITYGRIGTAWRYDRLSPLPLDEGDLHVVWLSLARHFERKGIVKMASGSFLIVRPILPLIFSPQCNIMSDVPIFSPHHSFAQELWSQQISSLTVRVQRLFQPMSCLTLMKCLWQTCPNLFSSLSEILI